MEPYKTTDGTNNKIFSNGNVLGIRENRNGIGYVHDNFYIGSYNGTHELFQGGIDEVHIYNRALSEKEVKVIYGSTIK